MKNRSAIHMLRVTAMRFQDRAPEPMVKALRSFAQELEARRTDGRTASLEEDKRVERQRTLFAMLPSTNATDRLREAVMQRAYDLLWDGDGQGCDALLEFLPSKSADEILNAWDNDQDGNEPKSKWH